MSIAFEQFESEKVAERKAAREEIKVDTITRTLNQIGVQEKSPVCWSPDGEELCYVNGTHGITICKRDDKNRFARSKLLLEHRQYVSSILYHPTKPMLISCGFEGLFVWDLEKGTCVQKITEKTLKDAHEGQVECMAWMYDGSILLTGGKDSTIKIWKVDETLTFLETLSNHKSSVKAIASCSQEDYFISAGRDSTINVWNAKTLKPDVIEKRFTDKGVVCPLLASMDGHYGDVSTLGISSDGAIIFSGARDNTIRAWDFKTRQFIREVKDRNSMISHKGDVTDIFCINNNQFLLSFSMDGTMHINQLGSMKTEAKMDDDLALSSLEDILQGFTETETEQVMVNDDLMCNVCLFKDSGVFCTAMNPKIPLMAVANSQNCIHIFDIQQNITAPCLIQEFISHSSCINDISVNEQNLLVSVSNDYTVNVFEPATSNRIISFNTGSAMYSVATNNDIIYTAGKDYVIHCYSINRPRFYQAMEQQYGMTQQIPPASYYDLFNLVGHSGKIRSIAFSKDLECIYSGSEDGTVMVHRIPELQPQEASPSGRPAEERPIASLDDHTGIVMDVAVSDDVDGEYYLASVGNDYGLNVYSLKGSTQRVWNQARAHNSVVEAVTFGHGPCAELIFTGGWDDLVKVWNCHTGELVKELNIHDERIINLCVSKDGKYLVSAAADKSILLTDISNDYKVVARYVANDECKCLAITNDTIVAGYETGVVRIWPLPAQ